MSLTNDTGAELDWSCSRSDLYVAPGETARVRIPEHISEQFGCMPQPASLRRDLCPSVPAMTAGASLTATVFAERYRCRG
ncbi:hypothetical protein C5E02_10685 [Rathayibacter rathayi]|uniref:Uncharacterized protein n=1 Tax=Rathayibacter rathayi TaxID=33887 RepID=A0ABD6W643_RATRA|nr:hypothetical protein [Rathayibacter rathayi]AZZ49640.1 hypothetical protein C1O28_10980 [Rathayibacter rathayi]MWV75777.1 hypothetical protein [Rathayibacter rathayi NCPPB 2980 = VKM Ac-1601]PPF11020.1 hypothetical protein C5C04_12660 [Rathayibacter rathayi]PPF44606.1 hypothetical protein C5C08_13160 [Rathayibacter rathayi]PPF77315.1 hypothetical protein C5C14_12715 [Rathayibacter rathayi]